MRRTPRRRLRNLPFVIDSPGVRNSGPAAFELPRCAISDGQAGGGMGRREFGAGSRSLRKRSVAVARRRRSAVIIANLKCRLVDLSQESMEAAKMPIFKQRE